MKLAVLDTNVLIDFLEKGRDFAARLASFDRLLVPAPVDAEFRSGLDLSTRAGRMRAAAIDAFLDDASVEYVPLGREVSAKYAAVYRLLKSNGTPIPVNDVWIAAVALVRNATLFTHDAHFAAIQLLDVEQLH